MAITFDPPKRDEALATRGLDFASAEAVFAGRTFDFQDLRRDDGETRIITVGFLNGRMAIVGWTRVARIRAPRGPRIRGLGAIEAPCRPIAESQAAEDRLTGEPRRARANASGEAR